MTVYGDIVGTAPGGGHNWNLYIKHFILVHSSSALPTFNCGDLYRKPLTTSAYLPSWYPTCHLTPSELSNYPRIVFDNNHCFSIVHLITLTKCSTLLWACIVEALIFYVKHTDFFHSLPTNITTFFYSFLTNGPYMLSVKSTSNLIFPLQ